MPTIEKIAKVLSLKQQTLNVSQNKSGSLLDLFAFTHDKFRAVKKDTLCSLTNIFVISRKCKIWSDNTCSTLQNSQARF